VKGEIVPPGWEGGKPELVDGRPDYDRALDAEVEAWAARRQAKRLRPSEERRRKGLRITRPWALVRCPNRRCGRLLIVARGQRQKRCSYCDYRFWLTRKNLRVVATMGSAREARARLLELTRHRTPLIPASHMLDGGLKPKPLERVSRKYRLMLTKWKTGQPIQRSGAGPVEPVISPLEAADLPRNGDA